MNLPCRVALFAALALLPLGCQAEKRDLSQRPVRAVATTGMIADAVRVVGGNRVAVEALMGPGVDPHTYKATAGDMRRIAEADVLFYHGLHLEGKMGEVFEELGSRVPTVAVTDRLDPATDIRPAPEGYEGAHDPHVWFDVRLWMRVVERVRDALTELDPSHAPTYAENTKAYLAELAQLHAEVATKVSRVPSQQRVLITAHDAFYYFGSAYGFEVRGLQGVSTATEPGAADVQELANFIAARRLPALFVESSVSPKALEAVQAAVRARGHEVRLGGELFSDALGEPGTPEGTYLGMVRHNIDTIVAALAR